jgi:transposase InsO family protein
MANPNIYPGTTPKPSPTRTSSLRSESTGDAYDNALAESFIDSFKTELINDRVWRTRPQLELAIVEYISWFNDSRLHENLNDRTPREIEELYAVKHKATTATS